MTIETELPAVKVKDLAWELREDGATYHAQSIVGRWAYWEGHYLPPEGHGGIKADDPAGAAQADYERRILSALTIKDDPGYGEAVRAATMKERERCASIAEHESYGAMDGEFYIASRIRDRIMDPSDVWSASDEDGAEGVATSLHIADSPEPAASKEGGARTPALHPSWEFIHDPFKMPLPTPVEWRYPVWDRQNAVCLMKQAHEVVGEVYQSLANSTWGDIKWHCKTSDERGVEKTHGVAEAKCEASFWRYEWMKATGRAAK